MPPMRAVSPLAESASLKPNAPAPISPLPVSLGPCWGPGGSDAREHPRRAGFRVVDVTADECERAVGRQGDGLAEPAVARFAGGGELRAALAPGRAGAGEDPRGAEIVVVLFGADERRVAVRGQRDAAAERARAAFVVGCQLLALLRPGRARPPEHPGGADAAV